MVSRYTTLVPSLALHIGPACEAGLSTGIRRERMPPHKRNKESHEHMQIWFIWCLYVWPRDNLKTIARIYFLLRSYADWRKISDDFAGQGHLW